MSHASASRKLLWRPLSVLLTAAASAFPFSSALDAATYIKADNTNNLNQVASWLNEAGEPSTAAPVNATNSTDILIWDNRVTGPNTVAMGDNIGLNTIRILDPGGPVVINGSNHTFTPTNNGGIDMSQATQDLTLGSGIFWRISTSNANITKNVAAGRTLTINAQTTVRNNSSGVTVNFTGAGKVIFNGPFAPSFVVVSNGEVRFNNASGNSRLSTNSTTINGGAVYISNTSGSATGSGPVAVNAGGKLAGAGIISGLVTVASAGVLEPGDSGPDGLQLGTLQFGSLELQAGSVIRWEATTPAEADLINVTSANGLTINGGRVFLYQPGTTTPIANNGIYSLIGYNGAIGGAGVGELVVDESTVVLGKKYSFSVNGTHVTVRIEDDVPPQEHFWNVNANGNWTNGANWTDGTAPNGERVIARFGGGGATITAPRTVNVDADQTVGALRFNSSQPYTIAGTGSLTLNDAGAAALIEVADGNHVIAAPIALVTGGALLDLDDAADSITFSGTISGGSGLAKTGSGTVVMLADHAYTGATSNAAGLLQLGNGGSTGSIVGAISNSGVLRINRSDAGLLLGSVISGAGSLELVGPGTVTLGAANTFSGATNIQNGSLVLTNGNALQNSTLNYLASGGTLSVGPSVTAVTLGGLSGDRNLALANANAEAITLAVGRNNASTSFSGNLTGGEGTALTKQGTGTLTLDGVSSLPAVTVSAGVFAVGGGSFSATTVTKASVGSVKLLVSGGEMTVASPVQVLNGTLGIEVTGGVANFQTGIFPEANVASGNPYVRVTGGSLNASSIALSRGSLQITNTWPSFPTSGQTSNGLYINGGAVNISGNLDLGVISGANSSVSGRMDSGSLTVDGVVTVGINSTNRWSIFDINGGRFSSTNVETGLRLGSAFYGLVAMVVRNGVSNVERIQFGQGALGGRSVLSLTGGSLYLGAGGLVIGSTDPEFEVALNLGSGTLGAQANWSTSIPATLVGETVLRAANEAGAPYSITLSGPVTGGGSIYKRGAGAAVLPSSSNSYFGVTIVEEGTLRVNGQVTDVGVNEGATLSAGGNGGTLTAWSILLNGDLEVQFDAALANPVDLVAAPSIAIGPNSKLRFVGVGRLPGPAHVIAKADWGVMGQFSEVIGLPAGFTLDYNYTDNGIPAIAIVGSSPADPYFDWARSFDLLGARADRAADPDGDGRANLLEYALRTNPAEPDTDAGYEIGRAGDFLTLTFDHVGDTTLTFVIEASDSLGGWSVVQTYPGFATNGTQVYTDTAPISANPRRFLRLRVTYNP
jgi:autotransporter-associated beta strand protein